MSILLTNLVSDLEKHLTDFLWKEWSTLGVLGTSTSETRWVIDPEVLLLLTSEVGRHEARLFDEVLDWLLVNSRWLNTQRLRSLHTKQNLGDSCSLAAIARTMLEHDPATKWRRLSEIGEPKAPPEALFRLGHRDLLSVVAEPDSIFEQYGLLRPERVPRSLAQPVSMKQPCALQFRLRALFGLGMRADILCYLLTHDGAHPSGVARSLGYSQKRVQDTMVEMAESGQVQVRRSGRMKIYWLDPSRWTAFLIPESEEFPAWVDWLYLARGVTTLWRGILEINPERADDYVVSSKMRAAMRAARDDLHASGINFDIADDRDYIAEAYRPIFERDVARIGEGLQSKFEI